MDVQHPHQVKVIRFLIRMYIVLAKAKTIRFFKRMYIILTKYTTIRFLEWI